MNVRLSSGDSQVRVKSQKYSELDIGERETCITLPDLHYIERE